MASVELWVLWVVVLLIAGFMLLIGWTMARQKQRKAEMKLKRIKPIFDLSPTLAGEPPNILYIRTRNREWNSDYSKYGEGMLMIEEITGFRKSRKYPVRRDDFMELGPMLLKGKTAIEVHFGKYVADLNTKIAHLEAEISTLRSMNDMAVHSPELLVERNAAATKKVVDAVKDMIPREKARTGGKK